MPESFLDRMAAASRGRAQEARTRIGLEEMRRRALARLPAPELRLEAGGFDLIAELKPSSPSEGTLAAADFDLRGQARRYANAGAAAISVLTEPTAFGGSLQMLEQVSSELAATGTPAMRKDFVVAPIQVYEARAAGAGGILLIVGMLTDERLAALMDCAADCRLWVLLEAFDEAEIRRSAALVSGRATPRVLLGLNCRNLHTLAVEPDRFARLARAFPAGLPRVAESGLAGAEDAAGVAALGYDLALVGSALMRSPDPARLLKDMLTAGRGAR